MEKESNLDLNDLTHDPAYFKFRLEYPKSHTLISDITPNSTYEDQNTIVFVSKKELRKNSNIILNKKPKFQVYVAEGLRIYSDVENEQVKSDSIVNKVLTFFNNKNRK